jgi:hypothetical protein
MRRIVKAQDVARRQPMRTRIENKSRTKWRLRQ